MSFTFLKQYHSWNWAVLLRNVYTLLRCFCGLMSQQRRSIYRQGVKMSNNTQQYETCKKLFIIQLLLCISCRVGKGKQIEKHSLFVTCLVQCTCTISIQNNHLFKQSYLVVGYLYLIHMIFVLYLVLYNKSSKLQSCMHQPVCFSKTSLLNYI